MVWGTGQAQGPPPVLKPSPTARLWTLCAQLTWHEPGKGQLHSSQAGVGVEGEDPRDVLKPSLAHMLAMAGQCPAGQWV